jgi:hypothetical protein
MSDLYRSSMGDRRRPTPAAGHAVTNPDNRQEFDFYPTPIADCADALSYLPFDFVPQCILDPGAGGGAWGKAARKRYPKAMITGVDVRSETKRTSAYNFWMHDNFLLMKPTAAFDLVIGNPPFDEAEAFVKQSIAMLEPYGFCIMLLRLNFITAKERVIGVHRTTPPMQVIIRANRVQFIGYGDRAASDYAYFIWRKGWKGKPTIDWSLAPTQRGVAE